MPALTRRAPAKLNLSLRVLGRRPDGFHDIESLVVRIGLFDTITLTPRATAARTLACSDPALPADERNLALRAALRLGEAAGVPDGFHLDLKKRIPAGAGLGGGSSDAAAVLRLLNAHWGLNWPRGELVRLAAELGSDVPLFLHGPLCLVGGRGEQVSELRPPALWPLVLFLPALHSDTAAVYRAWDELPPPPPRPPIAALLAALHEPAELAGLLGNDLELPARAVSPELARLVDYLWRACPLPVHMTWSGAAFFCLCARAEDADALAAAVPDWSPVPLRAISLRTLGR